MDTSTPSQTIPLRQGLAYIIIGGFIIIPSLAQFQLGTALFGQHPVEKILGIAAVGGALSGALFGGRNRWVLGSIAGMVAAVGAAGALPLYIELFHKERIWKFEFILLLGAGALPGILLGAFMTRFGKRGRQENVDA